MGTQCRMLGITQNKIWLDIVNGVLYYLGVLGNSVSLYNCHKLIRGQTVTGKGYDAIVIIFSVTAWLLLLRVLRSSTEVAAFPDYALFQRWLFSRYGAGCIFLFFWQLRYTYVTYKRIESEEVREEAIKSQVLLMEQRMTMKLLHSMVPPKIANDLSKGVHVPPEMYDFATVFFSDIEGFTKFASIKTPLEVFGMLNRLFFIMDSCVALFPNHLYKIETIGDAYLVVGGLKLNDDFDDDDEDTNKEQARHMEVAEAMAHFALLIREVVQLVPFDEISFVKVRMGIHTGPIVTGLSGSMIPRFSCYGDTINTASRMETTGVTNKIHVSGAFADLIKKTPGARQGMYQLESREPVEVKGKGLMQTYFLDTDLVAFREKYADALAVVETLVANRSNEVFSLSSAGTISMDDGKVREQHYAVPVPGKGMALPSLFFSLSNSFSNPNHNDINDIENNNNSFDGLISDSELGLTIVNSEEAVAEAEENQMHDLEIGLSDANAASSKPSSSHSSFSRKSNSSKQSLLSSSSSPTLSPSTSSTFISLSSPQFSFAHLVDPDFDVLQLVGDFEGICAAVMTLLSGVVGSPCCSTVTDPGTLNRLIRRVGTCYRNVPYHNWHHAMCVVQQTASMLVHLGLLHDSYFTDKERFVLMLAALVHDLDHPGNNNAFEVQKKSSLALLYNDQSVLENHHLSLAFNIMENRAYNVFQGWDAKEASYARTTTIECVLATDMDCHALLQEQLVKQKNKPEGAFTLQSKQEGGEGEVRRLSKEDRIVLKKCLLHAADISNPTRPFAISSKISMLAIEEFNKQAAMEEQLGLVVTKHMVTPDHDSKCRGEMFFLKQLARPYFEALGGCFPLREECVNRWLANIDNNFERWKAQLSTGAGGLK